MPIRITLKYQAPVLGKGRKAMRQKGYEASLWCIIVSDVLFAPLDFPSEATICAAIFFFNRRFSYKRDDNITKRISW